jgi:hypothetical protein
LEPRLAEVRSHPSGRDVYFQICIDPLLVGIFLSCRPLELKLLSTVARLRSTWSPLLNSFGRVWRNYSQAPTDCSPTTNANRLCLLLQPFLEATLTRWSRSWGQAKPRTVPLLLTGDRPSSAMPRLAFRNQKLITLQRWFRSQQRRHPWSRKPFTLWLVLCNTIQSQLS